MYFLPKYSNKKIENEIEKRNLAWCGLRALVKIKKNHYTFFYFPNVTAFQQILIVLKSF